MAVVPTWIADYITMFAVADDARITFAGFNLSKRGGLASPSVLRMFQLQREIESHQMRLCRVTAEQRFVARRIS